MFVLHLKKTSLLRVQKIGWKNSSKVFYNSLIQLVNLIFFRHKISLQVIGGECKSATDEMTSS